MRLSTVCVTGIVLVMMVGSVAAQEPVSPQSSLKVLSARRAHKFDAGGIVIGPKDKQNSVLTIVQLGGMSPEELEKEQVKKRPSLTCDKLDCRLDATALGGKKHPRMGMLLVFETPKDAQNCTLSFGDHDALDVTAGAEIRDLISEMEYLK